MMKSLVDEFLAFVKEEHGVILQAKESDKQGLFQKVYGTSFVTDEVSCETIGYAVDNHNDFIGLPQAVYYDNSCADFIFAA